MITLPTLLSYYRIFRQIKSCFSDFINKQLFDLNKIIGIYIFHNLYWKYYI